MTTRKRKAGVITALSGALVLLALWEIDEKLYGSEGKALFINLLRKNNPVNIAAAKAWLERTPQYTKLEEGDKDVAAVVEEEVEAVINKMISLGLVRRIWRRGK